MSASRTRVSFRAVNRRGSLQYDPALQRHHLLRRQLIGRRCFGRLFAEVGRHRIGFDDFRRNGLLLPAREDALQRLGLPLHRGPHRNYNDMVIARVGRIESIWSRHRMTDSEDAARTDELQPFLLNRKDPLGSGVDFSDLDAMAEVLWGATAEAA